MPRRRHGTTGSPWVTGFGVALFLTSMIIIKTNGLRRQVADITPNAYNDPDTVTAATLNASPGATPQLGHVFLDITTTASSPLTMTGSASPLPTCQGQRAAPSSPTQNNANWIDRLNAIAIDSTVEEYATLIGNIVHRLPPRYGRLLTFASMYIFSITAQRIISSLHHLLRSAMDKIADRFAAAPAEVREDACLALGLLLAYFYARPEVEKSLAGITIPDDWAQIVADKVREMLGSCDEVCGFPCLAFGSTLLVLLGDIGIHALRMKSGTLEQ